MIELEFLIDSSQVQLGAIRKFNGVNVEWTRYCNHLLCTIALLCIMFLQRKSDNMEVLQHVYILYTDLLLLYFYHHWRVPAQGGYSWDTRDSFFLIQIICAITRDRENSFEIIKIIKNWNGKFFYINMKMGMYWIEPPWISIYFGHLGKII